MDDIDIIYTECYCGNLTVKILFNKKKFEEILSEDKYYPYTDKLKEKMKELGADIAVSILDFKSSTFFFRVKNDKSNKGES